MAPFYYPAFSCGHSCPIPIPCVLGESWSAGRSALWCHWRAARGAAQHVIVGISWIRREVFLLEICARACFATIGLFLQQSAQDLYDSTHRCPFLLHNAGQTAFQAFISWRCMQPIVPRTLEVFWQLVLQYLVDRYQGLHMPVGFGSRLPCLLLPVVVVRYTYILPLIVIGQALVRDADAADITAEIFLYHLRLRRRPLVVYHPALLGQAAFQFLVALVVIHLAQFHQLL